MFTKLDRIARTATSSFETVKELLDRNIAVHVLNMGLVDNTPTGRLILQIMLSFAEFEREMIKERTAAGKAIARQKPGYKEGRPKQITPEIIKQIKKVCPGRNWGSAGRRGIGTNNTLSKKQTVRAHFVLNHI